MKAILLDEARKWLEENVEDLYMRVALLGIVQNMPMVDYREIQNEPLTIEQLREINEEPVWVQNLEEPEKSQWSLLYWDRGKYLVLQGISVRGYLLEEYGEAWLVYRYPPEEDEVLRWTKGFST